MSAPRILILRTGNTHQEVMGKHGDYDRWFTNRMEGLGCSFQLQHVPEAGIPDNDGVDGVLITGTAASVNGVEPWMEPLSDYLRERSEGGPPVLAVCFAAQLAAIALGGRVHVNPAGWEIGTVEVRLTEAGRTDLLFDGLSGELELQATHEDAVTELPGSAVLLAGNESTPVQAFAAGPLLRAVQFHPEADAGTIRRLIGIRRDLLEEEARRRGDHRGSPAAQVNRLLEGTRDTPDGRRILENWVRYFVRGKTPA